MSLHVCYWIVDLRFCAEARFASAIIFGEALCVAWCSTFDYGIAVLGARNLGFLLDYCNAVYASAS